MAIMGTTRAMLYVLGCAFVLDIVYAGQRVCIATLYDSATHMCCGGAVHSNNRNGKQMECCQDRSYIVDDQLCCGANIVNKTWADAKLCCNGQFYDKGPGFHIECCTKDNHQVGGLLYNPVTQHCCPYGAQVRLHIKNQTWANPKTRMECCGAEAYDANRDTCLPNGTVVKQDVEQTMGVCKVSWKSYNTKRQLCCSDGTIIAKPEDDRSELEIAAEYVCVNGTAVDKNAQTLNGARILGPGVRKCGQDHFVPHYGQETHCCNSVMRVTKKSNIQVSCCGTRLYNLSNQECCSNEILDPTLGYRCCNGEKYFTGTHYCCGHKLMDISNEVCCKRTSTIQWIISKTYQNHTRCCDNVSYNNWDMKCVPNASGGGARLFTHEEIEQKAKTLQEVVIGLGGQLGPRNRSGLRDGVSNHACPFKNCGLDMTREEWHIQCVKRNGFSFFLHEVNFTDEGVTMTGYMVDAKLQAGKPERRLEPHHITVLTPYHCACFKPGQVYWVYTNRPVWFWRRRLVFNTKDVIVHEASSFGCEIDRRAKKSKRHHRSSKRRHYL